MTDSRKKIAVIGTAGIPANYGGFETLADNITRELSTAFNFMVYCKKTKKNKRLREYNNSKLLYLPLNANGYQSIFYDTLAILHAFMFADILLIFGPTAGYVLLLNLFFKKKIIANYGGLNEWERLKYNLIGRKWLKFNYRISAKFASVNIADNEVLATSLNKSFHCSARVIKYGGDHVKPQPVTEEYINKYPFLSGSYAISVSRAQPDNNLHVLLQSFEQGSKFKLVIISNWEVSEYGRKLKRKYLSSNNIILLDAIYDQDELNVLRANATLYIHSHSMCGTAPSLVEAMCLNLGILCFDVPTNRETTENESIYFTDGFDLQEKINSLTITDIGILKSKMSAIASREYSWEKIAGEYRELIEA